ncbi:MAG: hypothetical protein ACAI35_17185 [Candidatus Methylacidiphilales bacterium]
MKISTSLTSAASRALVLATALVIPGAVSLSQAKTEVTPVVKAPSSSNTVQILKVGRFAKSEYTGRVGNMYAEFELTWSDNGEVAGTYTYPGKRGTIYLLKGENVREGKLMLEEYTGNDLTATISLRKSMDGDQVVWSGTMKNTDGRQFPVEFRRVGTR